MPPKKKAATKTKTADKTPKKRSGPPAKYNWEQAQQWFVEGIPLDPDEPDGDRDWPNLRVLSEKTGIPYVRVREKSAAERWQDLKSGYQMRAAKDRQQKRMAFLGTQAVEFDNRSLDLAKVGMQLVGVRMGEIVKEVNIRKAIREVAEQNLKDGLPVDRKELWSAVNSSELERLAKAAQVWQEIGRKALGTDIEHVQIDASVAVDATLSVAAELERDDPDRLAAFIAAMDRAGLGEQLQIMAREDEDDEEVVDAELVEG